MWEDQAFGLAIWPDPTSVHYVYARMDLDFPKKDASHAPPCDAPEEGRSFAETYSQDEALTLGRRKERANMIWMFVRGAIKYAATLVPLFRASAVF